MVFGKVDVAEPAYDVLLSRAHPAAITPYDIRRYGERFAVEAEYDGEEEKSPFMLLAGYIGVVGEPQNEGGESIAMTAPVVMQKANDASNPSGTSIDMTAPVIRKGGDDSTKMKMQFILPAQYDDWSKIPKPTNEKVMIKEVPPAVGAVHVYSGSSSEDKSKKMAVALAKQLQTDGVDMTESDAIENYQFWGYNPPFTIPILRRNEVWIELTSKQVDELVHTFSETSGKQ